MAKLTITTRLRQAADLCAIAGVRTADVVGLSVYRHDTHIQLVPESLIRVARQLAVPRRRIEATVSKTGTIHVNFRCRGALWITVLDRDHPLVNQLTQQRAAAIADDEPDQVGREIRDALTSLEHVRTCRECGCTDHHACIDALGTPCHWVADDLCSACAQT